MGTRRRAAAFAAPAVVSINDVLEVRRALVTLDRAFADYIAGARLGRAAA